MARTLAAAAALAAGAHAAAPIPGFRPPAVPLLMQSPEVNVWSRFDHLYDGTTTHWEGGDLNFFSAVRVDGTSYLLMGNPSPTWAKGALTPAAQKSVTVWATQTLYQFTAGAVAVNVTFTSPLLMDDWELLSRPAHYVTFDTAATDGGSHAVQVYFDVNANVVVRDGSTLVSWARMPVTGSGITGSVTALRVGATTQTPLADTNDRPSWGLAYLVADTTPGSGA
jgi:hypothetical protein